MEKEVLSLDIGGSNLRGAILKGTKISRFVKISTPKNKKDFLDALTSLVERVLEGKKRIRGIGVASAGPLKNGIIKNPPNLPLRNFNLKRFLERRFKLRVEIENDANCAALAEAKYGHKKKNFIMLTIGTGIGGGIIIDGKLYKGAGYGGELGHIILEGKKDFEKLWQAYRKKSRDYFGKELSIKKLLELNTRKSQLILKDVFETFGRGIGSLINIFDPEAVILTGGIRECGNSFLKEVRKTTRLYTMIPTKTPIVWSKLEHPGILGASLLI